MVENTLLFCGKREVGEEDPLAKVVNISPRRPRSRFALRNSIRSNSNKFHEEERWYGSNLRISMAAPGGALMRTGIGDELEKRASGPRHSINDNNPPPQPPARQSMMDSPARQSRQKRPVQNAVATQGRIHSVQKDAKKVVENNNDHNDAKTNQRAKGRNKATVLHKKLRLAAFII